jgi:hypothetical protein
MWFVMWFVMFVMWFVMWFVMFVPVVRALLVLRFRLCFLGGGEGRGGGAVGARGGGRAVGARARAASLVPGMCFLLEGTLPSFLPLLPRHP